MVITLLLVLMVLVAFSIPIAAVLGLLGLTLDTLYSTTSLYGAIGEITWSVSTDFILVTIPLFILLGEIMLRTGVADRMYDAMENWLGWLPGSIMHSNVGACALFAATSGSSVATAATIGTVALPNIKRHGYNERLFLGTLAAGGTLGILIPPSLNMIIYGVLTDTSIPQLYLAGILPGISLALIFMGTVICFCLINKSWGGAINSTSWSEKVKSLKFVLPPMGIFLVVVGSIYAGIATPTEAAALGVVAVLFLAAFYGQLTIKMIRDALEGTMRTTAMVMLIIIAAYFLNFVMSFIGLTDQLTVFIKNLGWTPYQTIGAIIVFYLVLGLFMETLSMMITTIPIITPIVESIGFDKVWFGVLLMILIETALITPPIGLNLYVVQGIRKRGEIIDVIFGAIPFVFAMFIMILLLLVWPELSIWLPSQFY